MEIRDIIRRQYHVYGRVQGVGFRYTVTQAADALGLTGWVRSTSGVAGHPGDVRSATTEVERRPSVQRGP